MNMQSKTHMRVQTFTRWCNKHLESVDQRITDLQVDFSDGTRLVALVQCLSKKTIYKAQQKPTSRDDSLQNVAVVLTFLEREQIGCHNIKKEDIVDGNQEAILRILWTLIQHYALQVNNECNNSELSRLIKRLNPERRLMEWIQGKIPSQRIRNFTADWNDGRALGALVNALSPNLCSDWKTWNKQAKLQNAREAMDYSQTWLNIPQLLSPEDVINRGVDKISMMTYLSQFCMCSQNRQVPEPPKNLSVVTTGRKTLEITWAAPTNDQSFKRKGFIVKYREINSQSWIACLDILTDTRFTLSDLTPYTMYEVRVACVYKNGMGPASLPSAAKSPRPGLDESRICLILQEANDRLCRYLEPSRILKDLHSKQLLTSSDEDRIRELGNYSDQVTAILAIVKRKSPEGYFSLMEALNVQRYDQLQEIMQIENKYIFGYHEENEENKVQDRITPFPLHSKKLEPIVTVRRKSTGGRIARIHYNNPDKGSTGLTFVAPKVVETCNTDEEELHIKVNLQTSPLYETEQTLTSSDLILKLFLQMLKPQYLSDIVNNVFGSHGGVLIWLETGPLHFYVKCNSEAASRIRSALQNGVIARQLGYMLLTDEVLSGYNLSGVSFKAVIDGSEGTETLIPGPPGQPTVIQDRADSKTTLSWLAPVTHGSSKGMKYIVEHKDVNGSQWTQATEKPIEETSLRIGRFLKWMTDCQFRVSAVVSLGQSLPSEPSNKCRADLGFWYPQGKFPKSVGIKAPLTPLGIAMNPNGELAIADYNTQKVQIYDTRFKHKQSLCTKTVCKQWEESRPWQVAVTSDGLYFITDKTSFVKAYHSDGKFSHIFPGVSKKGINSDDSDSQLCGIAVDQSNFVFVGDWFNMYISKHAPDGNHIETVDVNIPPYQLSVTHENQIVVGSLNEVAILDAAGQTLHSLRAPSFVTLWEPRGINCFKDAIIIANYANCFGGIYVFSLSAVYQGCIKVDKPWSVAVNEDGTKLFVAAGNAIEMFLRKSY